MEKLYAAQILETLADGINPATGEILPSTDSCNQPEVIRALHVAVSVMKKEKLPKELPENTGKPWTESDDETLRRMYENGSSKEELSGFFKRTRGAIDSRLARLGLV